MFKCRKKLNLLKSYDFSWLTVWPPVTNSTGALSFRWRKNFLLIKFLFENFFFNKITFLISKTPFNFSTTHSFEIAVGVTLFVGFAAIIYKKIGSNHFSQNPLKLENELLEKSFDFREKTLGEPSSWPNSELSEKAFNCFYEINITTQQRYRKELAESVYSCEKKSCNIKTDFNGETLDIQAAKKAFDSCVDRLDAAKDTTDALANITNQLTSYSITSTRSRLNCYEFQGHENATSTDLYHETVEKFSEFYALIPKEVKTEVYLFMLGHPQYCAIVMGSFMIVYLDPDTMMSCHRPFYARSDFFQRIIVESKFFYEKKPPIPSKSFVFERIYSWFRWRPGKK